MKTKSVLAAFLFAPLCTTSLQAGTPAQEKEFVKKYETAYENGDKKTLESFLYTKDANPSALELYKAMQLEGAGVGKVTQIALVPLSPEDITRAAEVQTAPDGTQMQLALKPTKKLRFIVVTKRGESSSTSSTENFIAEVDGKYVIPVPALVK